MNYTELKKRIITGTIIGIALGAFFFLLPPIFLSLFLIGCLLQILIFEMPRLVNYQKINAWVFTIFYPILPFFLLINLNQSNQHITLFIFLITFAHDSGAYFAGNFFGKHKLLPSISPKKTWEGLFGGIFAIFIVLIVFYKVSLAHAIFGAMILTIAATAGDLFESWLKRRAGIKDAGTLLPGHGGLLDRFDSIVLVTIVVCLLLFY